MDGYESLWIRVQTHNQSLTVGCTYRPPNSHPDDFCSKLEACLRAINTQDNSILILGDMNGKNNTWLSSDITDRAGDNLSCLFDAYGLHQHVDFPTRITNGLPKSCIDLVVTNYQEHQVQVEIAPPLSSSDHLSITGCLDLSTRFRSTSARPRSRVPLWRVHFSATHVRAINCHCVSVRAVSARLMLARRPLARQTCTSSFHCWGVFFYSKDGDQYYIQIIMKDSAVFIIINTHKLDFVLLLLNTIIQHILQVACKSRPK